MGATSDRLFAVVDAFADERRPAGGPPDPGGVLSLAELTRRSGLAKPTVHRICADLVARRILERTAGGYRLGIRLFELGNQVPVHRSLREVALPFLEDLYEATHELVHIAVLDGSDVVCVEKIASHRAMPSPARVGGRDPAYCTGVGKALLAFSAPEALDGVLARGLAPRTPYTIVLPRLLREQLDEIRRTAVAYDREELTIGMTCVAAPVLGADGLAVAALSVSGPTTRLDPERVAVAVRTAALGLGRSLRAFHLSERHVGEVRLEARGS